MPGTYKLFTAFVALIGNVSLMSTGEMNPAFSFIGTGLLWGYIRSLKGYPALPKWAVGGISLTTFIVFLFDFYMSGDLIVAVAQMTLIFQTIKSFDIKETWDPPQVFFVSLLQLLIASELTSEISFGVVFILFLIFIVVAVLLGHFVREGQMRFGPYLRPITYVTVVILLMTIVIFISLPRLRSSLWGKSFTKSIKTTGFSDRVDFGSFGAVKLDATIVARMIIEPDKGGPYYLRGLTFDYFDGLAWYEMIKGTRNVFRRSNDFRVDVPDDLERYVAEIFFEPINSDVIFIVKMPYMLESPGYLLQRDLAGSFTMRRKISKRFNYKVYSVDGFYIDNSHLAEYLQYPEGFEATRELSRSIIKGAGDDLSRARRIQSYLLRNYRYSLIAEQPEKGSNEIEHFLFNSKKGYCEHFATTMTLMLRSVNIPARLVTGFLTEQKNDIGNYYVIRQSDAHSWVEAFIDDRWMLFDPTPPVLSSRDVSLMLMFDLINMNWNRYVVGYSSYDQVRMFNYFRGFGKSMGNDRNTYRPYMLSVVAVSFIILSIYLLREWLHFSSLRRNRISSEYIKIRKLITRNGGKLALSSTSRDVLMAALDTGRFNKREIERFIYLYGSLRFSGNNDPKRVSEYMEASRNLRN
jgi:transglutaminase-like putative cysteine protease